ncbi:MAG: DUF1236 domain-containing protein [Pseudolabrys sp.]|nr:DUF1236 domain-containing protein [Pseudolabrys sp.]MDP2294369.1 DUF1236 domain-containing protein [Pseudolabrys sp.]
MKRTSLLSTAAVVLMLGAGTALAQTPSQPPAEPAPSALQKAPAEKIAPGATTKPATTAQTPKADASGKADMKVPPAAAGKAEIKGTADTGKAVDAKAADSKATDTKTPDASKATDANKAAPAAAQPSTTDQSAGAAARLSTEQRSQITTVIRQQKVQPVTLGVSISIGTRVPSSVRYYPLPREVFVIYPEWRGYDYILVGDQVLVLDPRTHEIVAILDA